MQTISLSMIVKNEESVLLRCLESVKDVVDEIVIVDTGSKDNTIEIAKAFGAKVYKYKWDDNFSKARNFSLACSNTDWHLVLDADEYLLNDSKNEIQNFINHKHSIGKIKIISKYQQNNEVRHSQAFISRIFPKNTKYVGRIHEQVESRLPRKNINIDVYHDGYYLKDKSARNIKLLLMEEKHDPDDCYLLFQLANEYRIKKEYINANKYFLKCYSILSNSYSFKPHVVINYIYNLISLKQFQKGLEIIEHEYPNLKNHSDFHFVVALFYMEMVFSDINKYISYFPMIEKEYLSCLSLGESNYHDSTIGTGSFLALYNLGVFYETTGDLPRAKDLYSKAGKYDYTLAIERLRELNKNGNFTN